jgi:hypothetical protein
LQKIKRNAKQIRHGRQHTKEKIYYNKQ